MQKLAATKKSLLPHSPRPPSRFAFEYIRNTYGNALVTENIGRKTIIKDHIHKADEAIKACDSKGSDSFASGVS